MKNGFRIVGTEVKSGQLISQEVVPSVFTDVGANEAILATLTKLAAVDVKNLDCPRDALRDARESKDEFVYVPLTLRAPAALPGISTIWEYVNFSGAFLLFERGMGGVLDYYDSDGCHITYMMQMIATED